MFEIQYFVLGFVQGITEFLPISSSAHLILIYELTNWQDQGVFTDVAVHVGTLLAVVFYLSQNIRNIIIDFFNFRKKNSNYFAIKIIIATLPALLVGFIVYEYFLVYLRNLIVIGWASIIFGIILYFADKGKKINKNWEELNFLQVFLIGICQSLAFIPGASRAGVTITGARLLNVKRDSAAIFSMLLSIPIILASLMITIFDLSTSNFQEVNLTKPLFAAFVAFITALLSIHAMMKVLQFTNFNVFIIYRIFLGILLLVFYA